MRLYDIDRHVLEAELPRFRGRRGVVQLRFVIEAADPGSESPGESWTRLAILDAGLPAPVTQYELSVSGQPIYRLDLAYPKVRVCIEFDGVEFHSTEEQLRHDGQRRAWLRSQGWIVIVVRRADLFGDSRGHWLEQLRSALERGRRPTFRKGRFDVPRVTVRRSGSDGSAVRK